MAGDEELRRAGYGDLVAAPRGTADRHPELFVAEGSRAVTQLLDLGWPLRSVLLSERRLANHPDLAARATAGGAALYVAPQDVLDRVAGYHVHRGVLALALRPPSAAVEQVVAGRHLVLAVEGVSDLENLGALFRNAAAFGAGAVVLDPTTADPFYRRVVRVSVGHVLTVPFARASRWPQDVDRLKDGDLDVVALTPSGDATLEEVAERGPSRRGWAVLVGAEGDGLSAAAMARADVTARLPMAAGVDSLNVATAAAVALYRLGSGRS